MNIPAGYTRLSFSPELQNLLNQMITATEKCVGCTPEKLDAYFNSRIAVARAKDGIQKVMTREHDLFIHTALGDPATGSRFKMYSLNYPKTVGYFLDRAAIGELTFDDVVLYLHFRVTLAMLGLCIKKSEAVLDVNPNSSNWLVNFTAILKQHLKEGRFADLLQSSFLRRHEGAERYLTRSGLGMIRTKTG